MRKCKIVQPIPIFPLILSYLTPLQCPLRAIKEIILIAKSPQTDNSKLQQKAMATFASLPRPLTAVCLSTQKQSEAFSLLIIYNRRMQGTSDQLHQVWLQCMQMNQCSPQNAAAFAHQARHVLNLPLTPSGQTLLMLAASISSVNLVRAVLSCKPNVKIVDSIGRTPLHYAAAVGCIEIFELLIKSGCDPLAQTIGGQTALSKACLFAQGSIIEWYLNTYPSAFEIADRIGKKPLQLLRNSGEELYLEVKEVYEELSNEMKE